MKITCILSFLPASNTVLAGADLGNNDWGEGVLDTNFGATPLWSLVYDGKAHF